MELNPQFLFNAVLTIIIGLLGWFGRQLWEASTQLRKDIHEIEVALPTNYVSKNEFTDTMKRIEAMIEKIYDKLDGKADK